MGKFGECPSSIKKTENSDEGGKMDRRRFLIQAAKLAGALTLGLGTSACEGRGENIESISKNQNYNHELLKIFSKETLERIDRECVFKVRGIEGLLPAKRFHRMQPHLMNIAKEELLQKLVEILGKNHKVDFSNFDYRTMIFFRNDNSYDIAYFKLDKGDFVDWLVGSEDDVKEDKEKPYSSSMQEANPRNTINWTAD